MLNSFIKEFRITFLLVGAMLVGSLTGLLFQDTATGFGSFLDLAILALIFFIFLEVPFETFLQATKKIRFVGVAWLTNFILIPILAFIIANLFFSNQPAILVGLLIYFLFPCTDWFLAFTKLAKGDTATGSVLLPINMTTQLLLYPVYLILFTNLYVEVPIENLSSTLINWFIIPFALALVLHILIKRISKQTTYDRIQIGYSRITEGVLTILVFIIFATNITTISQNVSSSLLILVAVFIFFVLIYFITERISRWLGFPHELKVLYTMTTSARNAPLMLAITVVAIPNQPLIYAAIIIGMLVEFPHLTVLTKILTRGGEKVATISKDQPLVSTSS